MNDLKIFENKQIRSVQEIFRLCRGKKSCKNVKKAETRKIGFPLG